MHPSGSLPICRSWSEAGFGYVSPVRGNGINGVSCAGPINKDFKPKIVKCVPYKILCMLNELTREGGVAE